MCKIKICGLSRKEDILSANQNKPDYIGFVFAPSRREVTKEKAQELKSMLRPYIKVVGVFVNAPFREIIELVEAHVIDIVQLHGDEDQHYIERLRSFIPHVVIIKAIGMEKVWKEVQYDVDYYLLDTKSKGGYGGTGKAFDWSVIGKLDKPYFLAGGIQEDNIDEAMKTGCYGIDLSSGVETDGKKDNNKIHRIVEKVRGYCG